MGTITVRSHAKDSRTIGAWARRLDIPYSGQQLQTFTGLVIDTLLRRKQRRYLKDDEKDAIKEAQHNQCNICGDSLGREDAVFDHIIPLHEMTTTQDLDACQAICGQCHADKTKAEARPCVGKLKSRFNATLRTLYLESPKPPCLAYKDAGVQE